MSLTTLLLIVALICFILAAIGWSYRKMNLLAIGLALLVLAQLLGAARI